MNTEADLDQRPVPYHGRMLFPFLTSFYMTRCVLSYLTPFELHSIICLLNRWANRYVKSNKNLSIVYGRTDPSVSLFYESATGMKSLKQCDFLTGKITHKSLDGFPASYSKFKSIEAIDNTIYIVGGYDTELNRITSFCYQISTKHATICKISAMQTARISFSLTTFGSHLIVVGGFFDGTLAACEKLKLGTEIWSPMSPLCIQRCDAMLCSFNGNCVYAFGGTDGHTPLNSIEKFVDETSGWQLLPPIMQQCYTGSRYGGRAHQISAQEIMIFGGKGKYEQPIQECYVYNAAKKEFVARIEMGAESFDNIEIYLEQEKLFVLGALRQFYNCRTKTWALLSSLDDNK